MTVRFTACTIAALRGAVDDWWQSHHLKDAEVWYMGNMNHFQLPDGKIEYSRVVYYDSYPHKEATP